MSQITFGSVCSGIEAASVAWHPLGWRAAWLAEIEPFPCAVLAHHYPDVPNLGDMTKIAALIRDGFVAAPDVFCGGTPCFTAGHMVLCSTGYKTIESVEVGDLVMTHKGRLQCVIRTGSKNAPVGKLTGVGMASGIVTTPEHPFLSVDFRMQNTKRNGVYAKVEQCGEPEWIEAQHLVGKTWCALANYESIKHTSLSTKFDSATAMYLAGMYLGDGYIRKFGSKAKKDVVFCLNKAKVEKFKAAAPGIGTICDEDRGATKVIVFDTVFADWLIDQFGELSYAKRVPAWVMSHEFGSEFLRGYLDTDGGITSNGFVSNSVSLALALGIADLANCHGYSAGLTFVKTPDTCVIEGRTVNQRDYWSVKAVYAGVSRKSRVRHGYLLRRIQSYNPCGVDTVYNIEVEGDNSYVINGAVVHNCQAFSIAGLRNSLDDARGNLSLTFCEIADEIDKRRAADGLLPSIVFWENVPGVLSTKDNAFGCFLAGLAGEDDPLIAPGGKWENAGCVFGPKRVVAWRVTDAQFFGVAQRRKRVFVVASAREGFNPCEVLFEPESLHRNTAPSREAREEVAGTISARTSGGGGLGTDFELGGRLQPVHCLAHGQGGAEIGIDRSPTLTCNHEAPIAAYAFDSRQDCVSSTEVFGALGSSSPQAQAVCFSSKDHGADASVELAPTMRAMNHSGSHANGGGQLAVCVTGDITHTLKAEGFDTSEDGTGRGQPIVTVQINERNYGKLVNGTREGAGDMPTRAVRGMHESECGSTPQERGLARPLAGEPTEALPKLPHEGASGWDKVHALRQTAQGHGVLRHALPTVQDMGRSDHGEEQPIRSGTEGLGEKPHVSLQGEGLHIKDACEGILLKTRDAGSEGIDRKDQRLQIRGDGKGMGHQEVAVRRLTPRECERLQSFPDDYTLIPYGRVIKLEKLEQDWVKYLLRGGVMTFEQVCQAAADGPRYKALGNSWCVNNVRWIGTRIDRQLRAIDDLVSPPLTEKKKA